MAAAIEEIVDIDLNVVRAMGKVGSNDKNYKPKVQRALCQVFLESYGIEKDKTMNIVSLILLD